MSKEEATLPEVSTFNEFTQAFVDKLGNKYKGVKLRVKSVYKSNGFVDIAKFPYFMELMTVQKADSKLVLGPKDVVIRPTPTGAPSTVSIGTDQLPF